MLQHEELIRTSVGEGMAGVPLTLDLGVMDVTTCTPLEDALVDICKCSGFFFCPEYHSNFKVLPRALQRLLFGLLGVNFADV